MAQVRRRRPWIAAILGFIFTGFGHVYLRRWLRGAGWIVAAMASSFFVPQTAVDAATTAVMTAFTNPQAVQSMTVPVEQLLPIYAVMAASIIDAYIIAKMNNQIVEEIEQGVRRCPACAKKIDDSVNFCQWCGTDLDDELSL
ncbi:zinc ribbon domain-containing protein [Halocatena halophila]|uniref:zinc ribbon domain-containing protein n=1 Tax=Halocatena halophila TaxID=2814576 RepID=UPI002ED5932C